MCGFIGRINNQGSIFAQEYPLAAGLKFLGRRGPDSIKEWKSEDGRVELLFARLAIVDTDSRAHQPLTDDERGITVAFAGEIYNYLELKDKLTGYPFKTHSDTEVLLALFALYGLEGLRWLRGMFALSIVDTRSRRIYLIRDPIGKKPLFIARWQDNVLFGSSVLALAVVNKKPVEINSEVLTYFWKNSFVPVSTSALSGARPVLPGEVLELDWQGNLIREGRLELEKSYIYKGESLEEVKEVVGSLLETAVKRRLTNNPKPTVLLSGGIDSTLVCAIAHKICHKDKFTDLQVITLRSFIPLMNDEFYARFAAGRIGTRLQLVNPAKVRLQDSVIKALDLQDEPLGMVSFFLLERLVRAAASYGKVLLTGDGGDEVFLGYGTPADWYDGKNTNGIDKVKLKYGPGIPLWMSDWARRTVGEVLVGHMLPKVDRASAEQGVEIRCPLLDWDLINYARSLPFEILAQKGKTKALLKDQLYGWPRWFLERPKIGFAYNLRWHWGLSNYSGLREAVDRRAIDAFEPFLPVVLRRVPVKWKARSIFQNFEACWRLLAWSRFLVKLDMAESVK